MSIHILRSKTTVLEHDDLTFELPINDPYDLPGDPLVTETETGWVVSYLVHDEFRSDLDPSEEDCTGWQEFVTLHSQRDADELSSKLNDCSVCGDGQDWHTEYPDDYDHDFVNARRDAIAAKRAFLFERYEHGQVVYALRGESSQVDRQWDVTPVAGFMWADDDWGADVDIEQMARQFLATYTDWCNGNVYGVVRATYTRGDDGEPVLDDHESCWGYIGDEYAEQVMKEEHDADGR